MQLLSNVTSHSEVWVLVDSSWDQAGNRLSITKDVWEWATESRSSLYRWESKLTDVVRLVKTEDAFELVEVHVFLDFDHIGIQMFYVLSV